MEEQAEENLESVDFKPLRKLNFNAPLLSTRRLGFSGVADTLCSSNSLGTLQNTSVLFSWEKAPGKPRNTERSDSLRDGDTPRPRLPPCLWHPPKAAAAEADVVRNCALAFDQDDGCDGDNDDDDNTEDVSSDAMDILSDLSGGNGGLGSKLEESNGDRSPTYMINRFLPDATALASSSSAVHFSNDFGKKVCDSSSPKGCGMELLFPWRMKHHKLCAIKSPVMTCSTNVHSSKYTEHCSSLQKTCKKC